MPTVSPRFGLSAAGAAVVAAAMLLAARALAGPTDSSAILRRLAKRIERFHGEIGIAAKNLDTGEAFSTNLLLRLVGTVNVDKRMASYGLPSTKIFRPTFRDGHADVFPEEEKEFGLGMTTPREIARLFELIAEGKAARVAACDQMLAVLEKQQDRTMIPRSLPLERDGIVVANKTGWDEEKLPDARGFKGEVRTDAAYVKSPKVRYVIAICVRRGKDTRATVDNEALVTGAELSRMVYDDFNQTAAKSGSRR